jgi:iron(III) transport system substrate-binding protein
MAYNTNEVKKADVPKTFEDLTDPKWKGRLGIEADDGDWMGQVLHVMGEKKGLDIFRRIGANGVSLRKGHTLLANLVVSGEVPLGMSLYEYKILQMEAGGAPIQHFYLDPVMVNPVSMGIARAAPHPNAAALFFDFMLSEGQEIYMKQRHYPSNVRIKPLPKDVTLHFMNFAQALDEQNKWTKIYKEIFLSRPH